MSGHPALRVTFEFGKRDHRERWLLPVRFGPHSFSLVSPLPDPWAIGAFFDRRIAPRTLVKESLLCAITPDELVYRDPIQAQMAPWYHTGPFHIGYRAQVDQTPRSHSKLHLAFQRDV
jgi:hypothetical protein